MRREAPPGGVVGDGRGERHALPLSEMHSDARLLLDVRGPYHLPADGRALSIARERLRPSGALVMDRDRAYCRIPQDHDASQPAPWYSCA